MARKFKNPHPELNPTGMIRYASNEYGKERVSRVSFSRDTYESTLEEIGRTYPKSVIMDSFSLLSGTNPIDIDVNVYNRKWIKQIVW